MRVSKYCWEITSPILLFKISLSDGSSLEPFLQELKIANGTKNTIISGTLK